MQIIILGDKFIGVLRSERWRTAASFQIRGVNILRTIKSKTFFRKLSKCLWEVWRYKTVRNVVLTVHYRNCIAGDIIRVNLYIDMAIE